MARIDAPGAVGVLSINAQDPAVELPGAMPPIGWREGVALHPLDASEASTAEWLRTLVWPGLAYLDADERARFAEQMRQRVRAGACRWISYEGAGVVPGQLERARERFPDLRRGDFVVCLDDEPQYRADRHATWVTGLKVGHPPAMRRTVSIVSASDAGLSSR